MGKRRLKNNEHTTSREVGPYVLRSERGSTRVVCRHIGATVVVVTSSWCLADIHLLVGVLRTVIVILKGNKTNYHRRILLVVNKHLHFCFTVPQFGDVMQNARSDDHSLGCVKANLHFLDQAPEPVLQLSIHPFNDVSGGPMRPVVRIFGSARLG